MPKEDLKNTEVGNMELEQRKTEAQAKTQQTNEDLQSNLKENDEIRFYSELTPENLGTSGDHEFELKNINPEDNTLKLNWKVYKYWNWTYTNWKWPNWLFYCDFWNNKNENFMVWEFQNWEMQKWFINYSFTQGKKYEAWKFDGEWRLINWKRVQRDWTIEEWEFENWELSGWKRVYPGGKKEIVFAK